MQCEFLQNQILDISYALPIILSYFSYKVTMKRVENQWAFHQVNYCPKHFCIFFKIWIWLNPCGWGEWLGIFLLYAFLTSNLKEMDFINDWCTCRTHPKYFSWKTSCCWYSGSRVRRATAVLAFAKHRFPLTRYTLTQGAEIKVLM